jgi:uncharacterized protein YjbJ (UPF0337 family)
MDKDLDQAKGKVKQAAGDLTGNKDLRREGKKDETAGKMKEGVERAGDKMQDAVDSVKDRTNRD